MTTLWSLIAYLRIVGVNRLRSLMSGCRCYKALMRENAEPSNDHGYEHPPVFLKRVFLFLNFALMEKNNEKNCATGGDFCVFCL